MIVAAVITATFISFGWTCL